MTLTNPLFLIALVAVALPIVVHLFNFRRYKKVYFSNVEQLEEILTETKKQSKLKEYLVLAARILAIVFLVLAFAQPVIPNKKSPLKAGGSAVSVYVDNSFSMENMGTDGPLLEQAKDKAREIAMAYQPSDNFQLITNDVEGRHFRWLSRDEFLTALDELEPSPASPTLSEMAAKQQDFLRSSPASNRFAYLLSDFQRSTSDLDQLPQDSLILTTLVPLEAQGVDNLFIRDVQIESPVAIRGSHLVVQVELENTSGQAIEDLPVKLYVQDKERAIGTVSLPAHGTASLPLTLTVEQPEPLLCHVEIADYPITFDDRFFFTINVQEQVSALCVEGQSQPFLRQLFEGDSLVRLLTCTDRDIDFTSLTRHDFIILNELKTIPSGLASALSEFVEWGGKLLVIPAQEIDRESYNQLLASLHAPTLGEYKKEPSRVSELNPQSGLYQGVFTDKAQFSTLHSQLELPTAQGHYKLLPAGSEAEPVMRFPAGDIFLSSTEFGFGMLHLLSTPLRADMTDFPRQALFVPTFYNMALLSQPVSAFHSFIGHEEAVGLPVRIQADEGTCRLSSPDGDFELIPDLRPEHDFTLLYPHNQVHTAGCYLLRQGSKVLCAHAFNYDRNESRMEFLTPSEVQKGVKDNHLETYSVIRHAQKPLDQLIRAQQDARPLWRWCLLLCLLFLALETALIRW